MPLKINTCPAIIIVHGKSEKLMVGYIKNNLRIPIIIISRDNGGSSIQVNGLLQFLRSNSTLKSKRALLANYPVIEKNKKLMNFKIFIVMDLDDCTEEVMNKYKTGEMFKDLWMKDYIVPIYNVPDFDKVMFETGYIKKLPNKREKGKIYGKIFPTNKKGINNLEEIKLFNQKMKENKNTNLEEMISYLLDSLNKKS